MDTDLRRLLASEGRKRKRHAYRISGPTLCKELGCVRPAEVRGRCRSHEQSIRRGSRRSQVKNCMKNDAVGDLVISPFKN